MLLLQRVMVHHLRVVQVGLTKLIVKSGMHMAGVLGMLVIRVLCTMATSEVVRGKVVVLTTPLLVPLSEMNQAVIQLLAVLGIMFDEIVLVLMKCLVLAIWAVLGTLLRLLIVV
jgi:dolichol kinase